jgi:aryl-alcohol dehydrogenase-like predicted oxidoreductase
MAVAKRELGQTGLQVTTLGYGAMELRGAPRARDITETQAETILNKVLDAGINYIDTSIDYGLSEERIGRYISHRRAEYYLASKCGCLVGAPPTPRQRGQHVFTRDNVVAGVEQSLVRMKTDYLDVVQFHASPSRQTLEEHGALDALLELREAGKVRFIGMSGTLPHLIDHMRWFFSMSFRSLIRRSSVNTKRRSLPPLRRAPASSFAVVRQRERQPRGSRQDCNGNAGAGHISMTCSTA